MDAYALHLAMAALVGASVVAFSAYFMHRKTLEQVLEYARAERESERGRSRDKDGEGFEEDGTSERDAQSPSAKYNKKSLPLQHSSSRRKAASYYRRGSASLPDVTAATLVGGEDDHQVDGHRPVINGSFTASNVATHGADDPRSLPFPPGLPRLHILPEGMVEISIW